MQTYTVLLNSKQEEGWVVCRVFKKRIISMRKISEHESPVWYDDQVSFMPDMGSPQQNSQSNLTYHYPYSCKKELALQYPIQSDHFFQLPLLESPKLLQTPTTMNCNSMPVYGLNMNHGSALQCSSLSQEEHVQRTHEQNLHLIFGGNNNEQAVDQAKDWRVLDKFVASQLSQEDVSKGNSYSDAANAFHGADQSSILVGHSNEQQMVTENPSTSTSTSQIDLWK
ncbi:unnamed protein product [Ilex paraguariensis]|uniref:NAC domain-containing protein n=1 Tax=Ilex paraguariensis TaxID=185542 RepID=A0ABC8SVY2_9AQUA